MNKTELRKSVGVHVQLRPAALDRDGRVLDYDWIIGSTTNDSVRIDMVGYGYTVALGWDHIYSFLTNPERNRGGQRFGFLQLHVQLTVAGNEVSIEPLPPPKTPHADAAAHARRFSPLTLEYAGRRRFFSWNGRDPLHLISREDPTRQLGPVYGELRKALGSVPGYHPRFNVPSRIRGEIVYELSPDLRAKWALQGGRDD